MKTPSLYLLLKDAGPTLKVYEKDGNEVWEQIKDNIESNPAPFLTDDEELSQLADTSIRNIYVLKKVDTHWQAINKKVVMTDR